MPKPKKRVTIVDVAAKAGVSRMTVSRVLNGKPEIKPETREHVQKVIDELGYQPSRIAQSLITSQTFTFGVTVPDIANPFFAEFIAGVETLAWENGYNILLCHTQEDVQREQEVLKLLETYQVDGVLICSSRLPDDDLLTFLQKYRAAVLFNRAIPGDSAGVVRMNDTAGTMKAVAHLHQVGCQRIGMIAGLPDSRSSSARIEGFRQAYAQYGYPGKAPIESVSEPDPEGGYAATETLLSQRPDIDGLVCHNDLVAIGAVQACHDLGKAIPGDIGVIGCDDILLARLVTPKLTTLHVDKRQLGAAAVEMLLRRFQGDDWPHEVVIEQELVVRESTPK